MQRHQKRMPTPPTTSVRLDAVGASIAVEHASGVVFEALREARLNPLLLKGPVHVRWLYGGAAYREAIDIDVLVSPHDIPAAEDVLARLGYMPETDTTPGVRIDHGVSWRRPGDFSIDLHWSLQGADPGRLFGVMTERRQVCLVGGVHVDVPDAAGRCFVTALQAAQHGMLEEKNLRDLRQALTLATQEEWANAAQVAEDTGASVAFAAALLLVPEGRLLSEALVLGAALDSRTSLALTSPPATAIGFYWLYQQRGLAERLLFVRYKICPPVAFMRDWRSFARRGRAGLVLAYLYRLLWLAWWAPRGYLAWRRAKKVSEESQLNEDY